MLINVVVEAPQCRPIIGEIQIHLREVLSLKETAGHHFYVRNPIYGLVPCRCVGPLSHFLCHPQEIRRASSLAALLADAAQKQVAGYQHVNNALASTPGNATAVEIELTPMAQLDSELAKGAVSEC